MPYKSHPLIEAPPNDAVLWRYLDLAKFVSLLEESALYFPPVAAMADPLEGFLTEPTAERLRDSGPRMPDGGSILNLIKSFRHRCFISCWHECGYESAAMWRLYLKSNEGIAIRTTFERFVQAIAMAPQDVTVGRVKYVDYESEHVEWNNVFFYAFHKRRSFDHEREVRAIFIDYVDTSPKHVPVDLNVLVADVFVAPGAPLWMRDLVHKLLKRYGLAATVAPSRLDAEPSY